MAKESTLQSIFSFYSFYDATCEGVAQSKGIDVIKNYPDDFKFHLVVHDFTCGSCLLGILPKFKNPPVAQISAFCNPPNTLDLAGGDKLGLTVKPFFTLDYDTNMNIFQRLFNGMVHFVDTL
jgi:glucuronosyltransferase